MISSANVAFLSQPALETLQATMQTLPNGRAALQAIDLGLAGNGVKYSTGGLPGQLVLSRYPLTDVTTTDFTTYLTRRVNLYATIAGVRMAFVDWPYNVFADIDPGLAPLQTGELQPDTAQDLIDHSGRTGPDPVDGVDVAVGTFSSSPSYQPEGYQQLVDNGFTAVTDPDLVTSCPASHAAFGSCAGQPSLAVDHILSSPTGRCRTPDTFATTPVSRHIGLSAVCAQTGTPTGVADSYRLDQGASLTVAAPGVLGNDTDPSHVALLRTPPAQNAGFALHPDGSFTYGPPRGFSGTDKFTYLTDDGTVTPTTVTLTVTPAPKLVTASPSAITAGGSVTLTATGEDFYGPATYSTSTPGASCTANVCTATQAGSLVIASSFGGTAGPSTTVPVSAGPAASVAAVSGDGQTAAQGAAFGAPLVARVTDAYGNPVAAGVPVTFTLPVSSATSGSATFPGGMGTSTVATAADGTATSPVPTAGQPGAVSVTATAPGAATGATYLLSVTAAGPAKADLSVTLAAAPQTAPGGTTTVTVTVTNAGPSAATKVAAALLVPRGFTVTKADGAKLLCKQVLLFTAPSLASKTRKVYTVTLTAPRTKSTGRLLAGVRSGTPDPVLRNNLAAAVVQVK